jgi:hypothetical protein
LKLKRIDQPSVARRKRESKKAWMINKACKQQQPQQNKELKQEQEEERASKF